MMGSQVRVEWHVHSSGDDDRVLLYISGRARVDDADTVVVWWGLTTRVEGVAFATVYLLNEDADAQRERVGRLSEWVDLEAARADLDRVKALGAAVASARAGGEVGTAGSMDPDDAERLRELANEGWRLVRERRTVMVYTREREERPGSRTR